MLVVAGVAVGGLALRPAAGVEAFETGVWWLAHAGGAPPPSHIPEGGLWVSSNASGPNAVSALRFRLGALESQPVVQFPVASNPTPDLVAVTACVAGEWEPTPAASWEERPEADCAAGQTAATMSLDGDVLQVDLSGFPAEGGAVDVVLIPTPTESPAPGTVPPLPGVVEAATFDITLERPTPDDVLVLTQAPPVTTTTAPPPPVTQPSVPVTEPTVEQVDVPTGGSPVVAPVDLPEQTDNSGSGTGGAVLTPADDGAGFDDGAALGPLTPTSVIPDSRTERLLAALVLVGLGAWWWRVASGGTARTTGDGGQGSVDGLGGDPLPPAGGSLLALRFGTPREGVDVPSLR